VVKAFLQEVAEVDRDSVSVTRLALRLPEVDLAEFRRRMAELLDEYAAKNADPAAESWSVFLAIHPDVGGRDAESQVTQPVRRGTLETP
jgi:hypothetical protein